LFDCLIPTTEEGKYTFRQFSEENMARLYEKFVLEYYKIHYKGLLYVNSSQIDWILSSGDNREFLPTMQSDISIWDDNGNTLIIDTKYYSHTMTLSRYDDKKTLHSINLYQIFTYVKNKDVSNSGKVSGILLYAKTNEDIVPDEKYVMSGNKIQVKTLDLNKEFKEISNQLDQIICDYFGNKPLAKLRF
jgi:5-methylcytosine-specific restriction enzyme subunit McrC